MIFILFNNNKHNMTSASESYDLDERERKTDRRNHRLWESDYNYQFFFKNMLLFMYI